MTRQDYDKASELLDEIDEIKSMVVDLNNSVNKSIVLKSENRSILLTNEDTQHFAEYYNNKLAELEKEFSLL